MKLLLGLLFIIITNFNTVYADILFLDLNNSPKEIEAAKKAAKQRGEKLIVFPERAMRYPADIEQNLNQKLTELKSKNQQNKISSLIISGHDGNGHFTGSKGSMSYSDFANILESHPELKESVKSLYLWGCYTATPGSIINNWKPTFKNLDVIIGYDGSAPANDKLAGHNYLADALVKEKKMTSAKTDKQLKRKIIDYSLFSILTNIGGSLALQIDKILIGLIVGSRSLAIFQIPILITEAIDVIRKAISGVAAPIISDSLKSNDIESVNDIYKKSALLQFTIGMFLLIGAWVCADDLFHIMPKGRVFAEGKIIILILGFSRLIDMLTGTNTEIISFQTKRDKYNF